MATEALAQARQEDLGEINRFQGWLHPQHVSVASKERKPNRELDIISFFG